MERSKTRTYIGDGSSSQVIITRVRPTPKKNDRRKMVRWPLDRYHRALRAEQKHRKERQK